MTDQQTHDTSTVNADPATWDDPVTVRRGPLVAVMDELAQIHNERHSLSGDLSDLIADYCAVRTAHFIEPDARAVALRDSLVRLRGDLDQATANVDAAIALFDALDDERLEIARRGIAASRAAVAGARS